MFDPLIRILTTDPAAGEEGGEGARQRLRVCGLWPRLVPDVRKS